MPPKRLSHDECTWGGSAHWRWNRSPRWRCWTRSMTPLPQPSSDTNFYNLGSINNHNVAIANLPRAGNCPAATVVTQMKMTFPNLRYSLLVRIGGRLPIRTDHGMIRLGHVVVSKLTGIHSGAIQYEYGKARLGQFERKGTLAPPSTALLNAARVVAVRRQRMDHVFPYASIFAFTPSQQHRTYEAEQIEKPTLALRKTVFGVDHPMTLVSANNLAFTLSRRSKYEEAEEIEREALKLRETALGKEHPNTLASMKNLAITLAERSKHDEALVLMEACFALSARGLGVDNPETKWRGEFVRTGGHRAPAALHMTVAGTVAHIL